MTVALGGASIMLAIGATDAEHAFFSEEAGIDWTRLSAAGDDADRRRAETRRPASTWRSGAPRRPEAARSQSWSSCCDRRGVGLFIMIGALIATGVIDSIARSASEAVEGKLWPATMLLLWASAGLSAIVDNIPYVATISPIVDELVDAEGGLGKAQVLWWALAIGADFGGNATAVGASATWWCSASPTASSTTPAGRTRPGASGSVATNPLLGWLILQATWTNVREHAAGTLNYWGSRGRRFESGRPDRLTWGDEDLLRQRR
ncbi:SLC13 family permease [Micromonospora sp. NPDC003944]